MQSLENERHKKPLQLNKRNPFNNKADQKITSLHFQFSTSSFTFTSQGLGWEAWLNFTPPKLVLHFLEYSRNIPWNIPYSKIFNISLVYIFFWNIPGIFHIPNNSTFFLFQDFLEYSIFQKIQDFLCCKFFWNMT